MTQRHFLSWLVLACVLACGCSAKSSSDNAAQPEDGASAAAPYQPDAQFEERPAVEAPALTTADDAGWPDAAAPPLASAPAPAADTAPPTATMESQSFGVRAFSMAAPVEEESSAITAAAPDQPAPTDAVAATMVPRTNTRAFSGPGPEMQAESPTSEMPLFDSATSGPPDATYHTVQVFYGTDRARADAAAPSLRDYIHHYRAAVGMLAATLVLAGAFLLGQKRKLAIWVGATGAAGALVLGIMAVGHVTPGIASGQEQRVQYGDGRGALEMGVASVSIPKDHRVGELEAPSVFRLEFHADPERHVTILQAKALAQSEFFNQLQTAVDNAAQRELLVFIHGYNVAFDNAVRRTAQIAYDLKFPGPAVCYSWPSSGALLAYTVDENNVQWTVPHLKQFLTQLREQSGADAINLVGHSMGTRALTEAVREFARESQSQDVLFNQVVLAAPDIDAEVFRRDLAPALTRTARRVTLYASSNDQALAASRKLHAYPRAGESGANLVVAPGLDTIDVSAIDTSLLGHSYYGDNDSIIADLYHLVHGALPPAQRDRLQAAVLNGLPYWVFVPAAARMATPSLTRETQ